MAAGLRSIIAFHNVRAVSYAGEGGSKTVPRTPAARASRSDADKIVSPRVSTERICVLLVDRVARQAKAEQVPENGVCPYPQSDDLSRTPRRRRSQARRDTADICWIACGTPEAEQCECQPHEAGARGRAATGLSR